MGAAIQHPNEVWTPSQRISG